MRAVVKSAVAAAVCAAAAGGFLAAAGGSASASTPPWEPDPNSAAPYGHVLFYDSTGHQLTGGSNLSHIADYAEATTAGGTTDGGTGARATMYFANPTPSTPTGEWPVSQASASTTYPNATYPAPLNATSNPVVALTAADGDLSSFISGHTANTATGYANVYQVRVEDSGPNGGSAPSYWETDIQVDPAAGTWTVIYPSPTIATTTTLSASPASPALVGQTVTLTATLSPVTATGTVQFKNGTSNLGSPVTVNTTTGKATYSTSSLADGTHSLSAVFTASGGGYAGSTSNTLTYKIVYPPVAWKPYLYGTVRVGAVDSCLAAFNNVTSVTYQWLSNGVAITGATAATYTVANTYYNQLLSCRVSASNPDNPSVTATSSAYRVAIGPAIANTSAPYISGTDVVGYTLTANHGTWSPTPSSYTYQWKRNGTAISGATSSTYKLVSADNGTYITCTVTAHLTGWTNGVATTKAVKIT